MLEAYVLRKLNGPELAIKILSAFFMQIAFAAFVIFLFVVIVDKKTTTKKQFGSNENELTLKLWHQQS